VTPQAYRVGAVVYHEKVRQIWDAFGDWFSEQGLALQVRFFDAYADQVRALVRGDLDAAWNTNLAYAHTLQLTDGGAHAIAMRDTDLGWCSHIVARDDDGHHGLADLQGARVGFGDADSPQAHILPVHALLQEGVDPRTDFVATRLDRDLGMHGDTGGAELAQLARVRSGELDACVVSSVTWDAVGRLGDPAGLRLIWTSPPFHHCNFTVLADNTADHDAYRSLLLSMDAADPKLCEPMELEYVNEWVAFDASGYASLLAAVAAGPVVVG